MRVVSGIPLPSNATVNGPKYPFGEMEIGDSFAVDKTARLAVCVAASTYKSRHRGWNYTVRTDAVETRVWRIA